MNPCLRIHADGVSLRVKVQPRASRNEIACFLGDELKVKVTAPPVDAAANEALLGFLAEILDCSRGAVTLIRGQTARHKVVLIRGVDPALIEHKLLSAL
ncbi:MAG: DUF167 domain-containing protein [Verrucomicrobiota bacterium]